MGIYRLRRKLFTKYDDTDNLKKAKDSDILAERKKKPTTDANAIATGALGAAGVGLAAGGGYGLIKGKGARLNAAKKFGTRGAIIGAGIATAALLHKRGREKKENQFYNRRLEYAQRQAMRREKADWKANMTQRDGYSY